MKALQACVLLTVSAGAWTCRVWAQHGPPASPVAVAPIVQREVPASMKLVGTVLPHRQSTVAAEVAGTVVQMDIDEGQFVRAGQLLCRLGDDLLKLRLAEAKARLGFLQAQLDELEAGTRAETIEQRKAELEEAEAILNKWEFERKRVLDLYERSQASDKERHDVEMEYLAARRRVARARAMYEIAVHGPRPQEISRARFDVEAQKQVVAQIQHDLDKTRIVAPFDGFLVTKHCELGEWVTVGGAVCELVALEKVRVRADVPQRIIRFARPGAPARVQIDSIGFAASGTISRVIPAGDANARSFPVEIDLPNPEHTLLAGMFAWVYVPAGAPGPRLLVPKDALVTRGDVTQVFVVRRQGPAAMAMPVVVETGLEWGELIEVRGGGLKPGDSVVVRGNERLYGPMPVIPKNDK